MSKRVSCFWNILQLYSSNVLYHSGSIFTRGTKYTVPDILSVVSNKSHRSVYMALHVFREYCNGMCVLLRESNCSCYVPRRFVFECLYSNNVVRDVCYLRVVHVHVDVSYVRQIISYNSQAKYRRRKKITSRSFLKLPLLRFILDRALLYGAHCLA